MSTRAIPIINRRSQRKAAAARASQEIVIPDKLYFRIGEVARLCRLPAYVLRFWETEFSQLRPSKSSTGHRLYRRRDVENVLEIKRLLYEEGFTIAGARMHLLAERKSERSQSALPFIHHGHGSQDRMKHLRQELKGLLAMLSTKPRASGS